MSGDIEELETTLQHALRRTDQDLLFAVTRVAPELMKLSYLDPPDPARRRAGNGTLGRGGRRRRCVARQPSQLAATRGT